MTRIKKLTPREREIVASLCKGNSNKMIARALNITEGTVKVHLVNIYRKLGIVRRTRLVALSHIIGTTEPAGPAPHDFEQPTKR